MTGIFAQDILILNTSRGLPVGITGRLVNVSREGMLAPRALAVLARVTRRTLWRQALVFHQKGCSNIAQFHALAS